MVVGSVPTTEPAEAPPVQAAFGNDRLGRFVTVICVGFAANATHDPSAAAVVKPCVQSPSLHNANDAAPEHVIWAASQAHDEQLRVSINEPNAVCNSEKSLGQVAMPVFATHNLFS